MKRSVRNLVVILLTVSLLFSGNISMLTYGQELSIVDDFAVFQESTKNVGSEEKSSETVIKISTEAELKKIADNIYGNYRLTKNITLSGKEWKSIPSFAGTLDGAGYTISNLKSSDGQGLFEVIDENAVVKNLTISGKITTKKRPAALLSIWSYGTVINCVTTGSVEQSNNNYGEQPLGGMIGENLGIMECCVNKATIAQTYSLEVTTIPQPLPVIGGLTAYQSGTMIQCENQGKIVSNHMYSGGITGVNNSFIKECINKGNVTANYDAERVALATGGIAGSNSGAIVQCVNSGNVSTTAKNNEYNIGGIAGRTGDISHIIGCKNSGKIYTYVGTVGGIVGEVYAEKGIYLNNEFVTCPINIVIADCVNEGNLSGESTSNNGSSVGGIIGYIYSNEASVFVDSCTNYGKISGKNNSSYNCCGGIFANSYLGKEGILELFDLKNYGEVYGDNSSAGGIFADVLVASDYEKAVMVTNCMNAGTVYGDVACGIGNVDANHQITFCYNTGNISASRDAMGIGGSGLGTISNCYNLGNIDAPRAFGITRTIQKSGSLMSVYNLGTIIGTEEAYGTVSDVFGVIGTIKNSYYLKQDLKANSSVDASQQYGTAITMEQAQKKETYIGFDFDKSWEMKEQNGKNLPALKFVDTSKSANLQKSKLTMEVGKEIELIASKGNVVGCYSEDPTIATAELAWDKKDIEKGYITAKKTGTVKVYVVFEDGQILTCQVKVKARSIAKAKVTLSQSSFTYNGKAKKPSVKVKLASDTLIEGQDYTVSYKNNKNIGTATVTITGKGEYSGKITKKFTISAKKGKTFTYGENKYKVTGTSTVAFAGIKSTKTTKVKIPKTVMYGGKSFKVTSVASNALKNKTKITSVVIETNVKTIGTSAFYGCKRLKTITIKSTVLKSVGKKAFQGIYEKAKIKVPKNKLKTYQKLFKGKGLGDKVKILKYK